MDTYEWGAADAGTFDCTELVCWAYNEMMGGNDGESDHQSD
jgi:cell wall-associated NlpC family hydrolase